MPSVRELEAQVAQAQAAYEAAEDARKKSSPTYLKAQVELREAALLEAQEAEIEARQTLERDLFAAEGAYREALDEAVELERARVEARERLVDLRERQQALRRQARAAGIAVLVDDSFAIRYVNATTRQEYRTLRDRIVKLAEAVW